jgi:hypothetical protein
LIVFHVMALIYKFKKEKLENGRYTVRPRVPVVLSGPKDSIPVFALVDTGCDRTVIPEAIAKALGLDMGGGRTELVAYRERCEVIESKASITFLGRVERESVRLNNIPVLISLEKEGCKPEEDVVLGIDGIFDEFEITFKKAANRIIMKRVTKTAKF